MRNQLYNSAFLDGAADWFAVGAAALVVDEADLGSPGRAVLKAAGTGAGEQGVLGITTSITPGLDYDCHARWWDSTGQADLKVEWLGDGDVQTGLDDLPRIASASGSPQWGVPDTFHRSFARLTAPANTVRGRLRLVANFGGATAYQFALLKPYIGRPTSVANRVHWDPGPSNNADLGAVPAWPHDLPPVLWDGFGAPQTPVRAAFAADSGIPATRKTGAVARTAMKGQLRLSRVQVELLRRFHDDTEEPFWFVRPDTDELCLAQWLEDGQPTLQQLAPGGGGYYGVGLLLAVA